MAITLDGTAGVTTPGLTNSGNETITGTLGVTGDITGSGLSTVLYPLVSGTAVASTSGTSIGFTSIPSWVKRITILFNEVSLNSTSNFLVQLGTGSSPTYTTSGYVATSNDFNQTNATFGASSTSGMIMLVAVGAATFTGHMVLTLVSGNTWIQSHTGKISTTTVTTGGGSVALAATLTAVRINTVSGTDTFDNGSVNIFYE